MSWEPGAAQEDRAGRDKAEGPKKVTDPKAGSGVSNVSFSVPLVGQFDDLVKFGYTVWPMDIGVYLWMSYGISVKVDV